MSSILIVEDEPRMACLMAEWLERQGYRITTAPTAERALEEMARAPAAVAVCDVFMPGRNGIWLAGQLRARFPDTAVIMSTGAREVKVAATSIRAGAIDYLIKPFGLDQLSEAVRRGLIWHQTAREARARVEGLQAALEDRHRQLAMTLAQLETNTNAAVEAMLRILAYHRPGAREHAQRVARLSTEIARVLGIRGEELADLHRGALLHDLGTFATRGAVLAKRGDLTAGEREVVRRHPQVGHEMLKTMPPLANAAIIVRAAQERFDGTGYPDGLSGDRIPLGSRIVAVADSFDVMTHRDPSRARRTPAEAVEDLLRAAGTQFDPRVLSGLQMVVALG